MNFSSRETRRLSRLVRDESRRQADLSRMEHATESETRELRENAVLLDLLADDLAVEAASKEEVK